MNFLWSSDHVYIFSAWEGFLTLFITQYEIVCLFLKMIWNCLILWVNSSYYNSENTVSEIKLFYCDNNWITLLFGMIPSNLFLVILSVETALTFWSVPNCVVTYLNNYWIAMTFYTDIHFPNRMNPIDSGCPLTSPEGPLWGWHFWFFWKCLDSCWTDCLDILVHIYMVSRRWILMTLELCQLWSITLNRTNF